MNSEFPDYLVKGSAPILKNSASSIPTLSSGFSTYSWLIAIFLVTVFVTIIIYYNLVYKKKKQNE